MYRIAYLSLTTEPLPTSVIGNILEVSRRNNERDDLTGMLLLKDDMFLQIIEGEEDKVRACYDRISKDPRHEEIDMIYRRNASTRAFQKWAMAFARPWDLPSELAPVAQDLHAVASAVHKFGEAQETIEVTSLSALIGRFLDEWREDDWQSRPLLFADA